MATLMSEDRQNLFIIKSGNKGIVEYNLLIIPKLLGGVGEIICYHNPKK